MAGDVLKKRRIAEVSPGVQLVAAYWSWSFQLLAGSPQLLAGSPLRRLNECTVIEDGDTIGLIYFASDTILASRAVARFWVTQEITLALLLSLAEV